jgi:hypothetical protein
MLHLNICDINMCTLLVVSEVMEKAGQAFQYKTLHSFLTEQEKYHCALPVSCNNVAPVTNLCLGRATMRSHSSQWSKKKVAVET